MAKIMLISLKNSEKGILSIIIPAYNEEKNIKNTAETISNIMNEALIPFELIFVDDGSKDETWNNINKISEEMSFVYGIHFSRNFGKEAAIMAGLTESKGDCCVVIDCDLQHPPEKIVEMYSLWENGYEIIEGCKASRGNEGKLHSLMARMFYSIISAATGFNMENSSDFKLLDRKAVNAIVNMRERNAFFRAMSSWIGFRTTTIKFDVQERKIGESKWSTMALTTYALNNISSFSTAPMQIVTVLGGIMFVISVILGGISLIQKLYGQALGGFTTVILILLFSSSIIMISLGIIGYYIAKIYEEIKNRPRYIISERTYGEHVNETVID